MGLRDAPLDLDSDRGETERRGWRLWDDFLCMVYKRNLSYDAGELTFAM